MTERSNDAVSEANFADTACDKDPVSSANRDSDVKNNTKQTEENQTNEDPIPSIDDMVTNVKWVILQKQQELIALGELTSCEVDIAKRSVVVTGIATLAAFVFACFCWLITNIGVGLVLHNLGVSNGFIALIVFILNLALAIVAFTIAKQSYGYITLMPAIRVLMKGVGVSKTPAKKE